ncbi:MAG: hypothetical protein ACRC5A_13595, partial [Enterobacteriaceae bacterium]
RRVVNCIGAVVVLVVLANDHLIMITAHFPLFFLKIRHFFYRYQLVDTKDPTYKYHKRIHRPFFNATDCFNENICNKNIRKSTSHSNRLS